MPCTFYIFNGRNCKNFFHILPNYRSHNSNTDIFLHFCVCVGFLFLQLIARQISNFFSTFSICFQPLLRISPSLLTIVPCYCHYLLEIFNKKFQRQNISKTDTMKIARSVARVLPKSKKYRVTLRSKIKTNQTSTKQKFPNIFFIFFKSIKLQLFV